MAIDKNTLVLLHLDDNLADECGHTFTAKNIGYTNAKFGQGVLAKGADSVITCQSPGFALGGADFTVDFWMYNTKGGGYRSLYAINYDSTKGGLISEIMQYDWNTSRFYYRTNWSGSGFGSCSFEEQYDKWQHYAFVYQHATKTTTIYVDGKKVASETKECPRRNVYSIRLFNLVGDTLAAFGNIFDEFRISDCARWTANFTPQKVPYGSESAGGGRR